MQEVDEREYQRNTYLPDVSTGSLIKATLPIPSDEFPKLVDAYPDLQFLVERSYKDNRTLFYVVEVSKK